MLGRAIVLGLAVATLSGITASAGWDDIHRLGRAADDTQAGMNSSIPPALTHSDKLMAQAVKRAVKSPKAPAPAASSLSPGWYKNSAGQALIYEDTFGKVSWGNSYVYKYPGTSPLYWYVQVVYTNKTSGDLLLYCVDPDPKHIKENMRGTPNSGIVAAEEWTCSRNPNFSTTIGPGGFAVTWAIFHNVPWPGGEVSLEWGPFQGTNITGSSPWVNPWSTSFSASPPAECPPELVRLGVCQPGSAATVSSKEKLPLLTQ